MNKHAELKQELKSVQKQIRQLIARNLWLATSLAKGMGVPTTWNQIDENNKAMDVLKAKIPALREAIKQEWMQTHE